MDHYGYGGGFMWILFFIVIVLLIYAFMQKPTSKDSDLSASEKPLDILKKRYAKGEITKDEFEKIKKDL
jgi:putative membrane protein